MLWGIQTVRDRGRKLLVVGTLIPVTFVLLSQTVVVWMGRVAVAGRTAAAVVITVLFLLSLAMLLRAAYAGVVFESSEPAGRRG